MKDYHTYTAIDHTYTIIKTKLTITVDRELLPKTRRYARARVISLSFLIKDALRGLAKPEKSSFTERWRGRFVLADRNDERYRALADKYR